ncbi:MAG: winged helix-turn-helix domain-containing protein [Rhodobacteraceae bacterium]|nr:winged helix-turn-helix domain-containing protein [Paracoccaceae bacterium]
MKKRFDPEIGIVWTCHGDATPLGPTASHLLRALAFAEGEVVSKGALMSEVWGDTHVTEDSLYHAISEIRKALGDDGAKVLKTLPRRGYVLAAPDRSAASPRTWLLGLAATVVLALSAVFLLRTSTPAEPLGIAILPFETDTASERWRLIGEGMASEVATSIAQNGWLQVYGVEAAGHARFALTGLVQENAGRIHIQVRLSEVSSDRLVWSGSWNGTAETFLDLQADVAVQVASQLGGHWSGSVVRHDAMVAALRSTESLDAYALYLRAVQAKHRFTTESYDEARDLLHRSLAIDPGFAKAWSTLSVVEALRAYSAATSADLDFVIAERIAAVERGVVLAPDDPTVIMELGWLQAFRGDRAASADSFRRAVELAPKNADVLAYAALAGALVGTTNDVGVDWIERALSLHPAPPPWYSTAEGFARLADGDYRGAIRVLEQSPNPVSRFVQQMAAYHAMGEFDNAARAGDSLMRFNPDMRIDHYVHAQAMDMNGTGRILIEAALAYGLPLGDYKDQLVARAN